MDADLGVQFDGGAFAGFRLSPQDYHRYQTTTSYFMYTFPRHWQRPAAFCSRRSLGL
jgi:hypothetical protein